jgi:hypothetical protein
MSRRSFISAILAIPACGVGFLTKAPLTAEEVVVRTKRAIQVTIKTNEQLERDIIDALAPIIKSLDRNASQAVEAAVRKAAEDARKASKRK